MKKTFALSLVIVMCSCFSVFGLELANNAKCPVQGNPVDGKNFANYEGKVYGVCCPDCIAKFEQEPVKYIATMSKDTVAAQKASGCACCGPKKGNKAGCE